MAKQILFGQEAMDAIKRGVSKIASAVNPTLGPRGRSVVLDKGWGAPVITKDGVSVAEEVELEDPNEDMAAKMIKEAASKTNDKAGDGTTTSCVLAETLFLEALKIITAGANPLAVSRGIKLAAGAVAEDLTKSAEKISVSDRDKIISIAAGASNGDRAVGSIIADALQKVGKDGVITIEEGKGIETE